MTTRKATPKATPKATTAATLAARPDLHLPTWTQCPDCLNRSTGRIAHGPHPKDGKA